MNFKEIDVTESQEEPMKIKKDNNNYLNYVFYGVIILPVILIFSAFIFNKIE